MDATPDTVFLLDIDGVINESQQPISEEMRVMLLRLARRHPTYFVTGNSYTKAVDILGSPIRDFMGVFCNSADELRTMRGKLMWADTETPPLPQTIEMTLRTIHKVELPNCVEWRSPRILNFSQVGRFASAEQRAAHDASWRQDTCEYIKFRYPTVDAVVGGAVSIDIYSKGADKARAAKYMAGLGRKFIFIGDKTAPGGNDYPIKKYCDDNPQNICLTTDCPKTTLEILGRYIGVSKCHDTANSSTS